MKGKPERVAVWSFPQDTISRCHSTLHLAGRVQINKVQNCFDAGNADILTLLPNFCLSKPETLSNNLCVTDQKQTKHQ